MHEKIKNLSEIVDKLIELNFKVKTENKSLKGKITELEQKISNYSPNLSLEDLTKGVSKSKIQRSLGNPERKGKFANGDELWGFKNYTLKFDKNGKLKNWSKNK